MNQLFRVAYFSRNTIAGSDARLSREVQNILSASRRNNRLVQVTGALLYNRSCFAQVLEGPLHAIERTFERIQRDTRHTDVTVLDLAEITLREFPAWSMAFAGRVDDRNENFASLSAASIRRDGLAAEHLLDLLHGVMLQEEEVVLAQTA